VRRFTELVENPIMYSKPDYTTFTVDGWKSLLCLFSWKVTAASITPEMKTMMTAKKPFRKK
jgi:hypothetical protein